MATHAPFGTCVVCGLGMWSKPMVYHAVGPLCWGCWSKLKRGQIHVDGKPRKPSWWQRVKAWLGTD